MHQTGVWRLLATQLFTDRQSWERLSGDAQKNMATQAWPCRQTNRL